MVIRFSEVIPSLPYILEGTLITLKYTGISILFGLLLGILVALMRLPGRGPLSWFAKAYTSVFRGTPLLVQLLLIYYATPQLLGYKITAFEAGILTFSLNSAAYVSEVVRSGILAVDKGQFEASDALGVPYRLSMRDIILPQAIKNILPALVNEFVNLLKESALVSVLGEYDLLRRANIVAAEKFIYFEPLLLVAAIYYILVVTLSTFANRLEKRLRRSD